MDMGFATGRYYLDDFVFTTPELYNLNQLINSDFTDGSIGWSFFTQGGAQAAGLVIQEEFVISIYDAGRNTRDIHLQQNDLLIETGREYSVSFDAYAASPRDIYAFVGKNSTP